MFLYPRSKGHIHFILVFLFVCPPVCLFITIILQRFLNYFKLHVLEILPHSFVYVSHMMGLFFVQKKRPLPLEKRRCHFKLYFSKKNHHRFLCINFIAYAWNVNKLFVMACHIVGFISELIYLIYISGWMSTLLFYMFTSERGFHKWLPNYRYLVW